jgi:hypothetical protein
MVTSRMHCPAANSLSVHTGGGGGGGGGALLLLLLLLLLLAVLIAETVAP